MQAENHIYPIFDRMLGRADKEALLHQHSVMIWFTGLSGSGKSTIAIALERELQKRGLLCRILDGDNIRSGINNNLGFSAEDRVENSGQTLRRNGNHHPGRLHQPEQRIARDGLPHHREREFPGNLRQHSPGGM